MNRTKKLMALLAALLVLIVAFLFLKDYSQEIVVDDEEEDTSVTVVSMNSSKLESISWTMGDVDITLVKSDDKWIYEADSAFPVDEYYVETMCGILEQISATYTIEAPDDLTEYGLDEPALTITAKGETEVTISIGSKSSASGSKYISIGDGNVYMVSSSVYSAFAYELYDIVEMESIPSMTNMLKFTIQRGDETFVLLYNDDGQWAYSAEYIWFIQNGDDYTPLDTDSVNTLINGIKNLSLVECVAYNATDEELEAYGLLSSSLSVIANYTVTSSVDTGETDEDGNAVYEDVTEEKTFTVIFGNADEDGTYTYARLGDSRMVYKVNTSSAETMSYITADELLPDEILLMDMDTVDSVDVTLDGTTYHIEKQTKEVTDDDGNVTEETVYVVNDVEVDLLTYISSLTSLTSDSSVNGSVTPGNAEISFTFNRNTDNFATVDLTFYQYNSTSCIASLNGETRLLVARSTVAELIESFAALVATEE